MKIAAGFRTKSAATPSAMPALAKRRAMAYSRTPMPKSARIAGSFTNTRRIVLFGSCARNGAHRCPISADIEIARRIIDEARLGVELREPIVKEGNRPRDKRLHVYAEPLIADVHQTNQESDQ